MYTLGMRDKKTPTISEMLDECLASTPDVRDAVRTVYMMKQARALDSIAKSLEELASPVVAAALCQEVEK